MKKVVIFDFFRTLFNPDTNSLYEGTKEVLETLKERGFELSVVSHAVDGRGDLAALGIDQFFTKVVSTEHKSREDFESVLDPEVDKERSFVVGDRVEMEIRIGNELGLQTIWVKQGKFGLVDPTGESEKPDFTVSTLSEVLEIIKAL